MAVDEALAEAVGSGASPSVVRLYGFSPPTLSLGRFQRVKGLVDQARMASDGVILVRRPTGGHAVLHDAELTYSVMLSREESGKLLGSARKRAVYEFIARFLLRGLENLGIQGRLYEAQQGDVRNPDCFGSAGEYEIAGAGGRKLIGSAQMATRTAVLQHGSIPLLNPAKRVFRYIRVEEVEDSHEPSSLEEEAGRTLDYSEVQEAFARAFREGVGAVESTVTPEEDEAARRIMTQKYDTDAWNFLY